MEWNGILDDYRTENFDRLHQKTIQFLSDCKTASIEELKNNILLIDQFLEQLFFVFSKNTLKFSLNDINRYFSLYKVLANLIRISKYKNSDIILKEILKNTERNIVKILLFYSPFNSIKLDLQQIFAINEDAASVWFCHFLALGRTAVADPMGFKQLSRNCKAIDLELKVLDDLNSIYFGTTYIDNKKDVVWKKKINEFLQQEDLLKRFGFNLSLNKKQVSDFKKKEIAVVSDSWRKEHSVWRTQYHLLKALSEKYDLVLFGVVPPNDSLDESLFKKTYYLSLEEMVKQLQGNFPMIFFTDIGFSIETIILSNMDLAPIQITTYGHPVSTCESKINYWIGGLKSESGSSTINLAKIQKRYTEKFVELPGLGIINNIPNYIPKNLRPSSDPFIINCSWGSHKTNYKLLKTLKNILKKVKRKNVVFRVFSYNFGLDFVVFEKTLKEQFGEQIEVLPALPYEDYMQTMEQGQFSIEPFPFGGTNTVVDALWIRQPIVCLEGDRYYSKVGSCLLSMVQADPESNHLLATSIPQYEEFIINLIDNPELLQAVRKHLKKINLDDLFSCEQESHDFVNAIDRLLNKT